MEEVILWPFAFYEIKEVKSEYLSLVSCCATFLGKCENGLANNRCMVYLELLLFLAFGVPEWLYSDRLNRFQCMCLFNLVLFHSLFSCFMIEFANVRIIQLFGSWMFCFLYFLLFAGWSLQDYIACLESKVHSAALNIIAKIGVYIDCITLLNLEILCPRFPNTLYTLFSIRSMYNKVVYSWITW